MLLKYYIYLSQSLKPARCYQQFDKKIPEGVSARHCDNVTVVFRPCSNMTLAKE